jgi:hypothetical protein
LNDLLQTKQQTFKIDLTGITPNNQRLSISRKFLHFIPS